MSEQVERLVISYNERVAGLREPRRTDAVQAIIREAMEDLPLFRGNERASVKLTACWRFCCDVGFQAVYDGMFAAAWHRMRTQREEMLR